MDRGDRPRRENLTSSRAADRRDGYGPVLSRQGATHRENEEEVVAAMFMKILLPLDLSGNHQQAIDMVGRMAHQSRGEVTLLHVIEIIPDMPLEEEQDFYGLLESKARDHLARLGQRFEEYQVPWRLEVVYGKRAPTILQHALESSTDLIVLTADRIIPGNDTGPGTISYPVSFFSQCPVLLLK